MNICLVNPPWVIQKGDNIWSFIKAAYPPLGLLMLSAVLERENIENAVVDFSVGSAGWKLIEEKIKVLKFDYFGITITTSTANNGYRLARLIRKIHPYSHIIFGGIHATALPDEPFKNGEADFVVRGDGEETLVELLRGASPETIPGASYKKGGSIFHVQPDGLINDLDNLPFAAYHKIDISKYKPAPASYQRLPAINMVTTRGCLGKCTFCNSSQIKLRRRSAENILDEIKFVTEKFGIREVSFYDDSFTVFPQVVYALCEMLIKNKIDITWSCFTRVDCVNKELLKIMKASGCHQIMYGIETANSKILENIDKNVSLDKVKNAIDMTKKTGITVRCTFMFGNPGETKDTIDETISYSISLDPDIALYNITTPYPGTKMFKWAKQHGYLVTENWDDYDLSTPIMTLPTINNAVLRERYKMAFRVFYLRPRFILNHFLKNYLFNLKTYICALQILYFFIARNLDLGRKGK